VVIRNNRLNLYVAAEFSTSDYNSVEIGALRARTAAADVGPWELFTICNQSDGSYTLQSDRYGTRGVYVTADFARSGTEYGMLRANATAVGPWEKFDILCPSACYLWSDGTSSNRIVSAEVDYTGKWKGLLRARSDSPGSWEAFS